MALFRLIEGDSGKIIIDGLDISKMGLNKLRNGRASDCPRRRFIDTLVDHVSNESARENFIICALPLKRSSLSIIPQEPILFTGTLRDNLDQWGKANDEKVVF